MKHTKAIILNVGTASVGKDGQLCISGWAMDCTDVPAFNIIDENNVLIGGYSKKELLEIASRKDEWQPLSK